MIKAFFFSPGFTLVILRKMLHALWGAGNFNSLREGHVLQLKTHSCTPEDTGYHLIVRCMCLIGNCRGQTLNESMPGSILNAVHFPDTHSSHCLSSGLLLNEI